MSEVASPKCVQALGELGDDPQYNASLTTFLKKNGGSNEHKNILQDCPCLTNEEAPVCVCDLQKRKVWNGVAEMEKACSRAGGRFCFTNEFVKNRYVDISLIHITTQCVPLQYCKDKDIALMGEAVFEGKGTVELSCPFVEIGKNGALLGPRTPQESFLQNVLPFAAILVGVFICFHQCFSMYKSYRDERDKMWSFKASNDSDMPMTQGDDNRSLRRRKLEVELSQLQNGQLDEHASVEVDLDQLNDSSPGSTRRASSSLKCV